MMRLAINQLRCAQVASWPFAETRPDLISCLPVAYPPVYVWYTDELPVRVERCRRIPVAEFMEIYAAKGFKRFEYTEQMWLIPALIKIFDAHVPYEEHTALFHSYFTNPQTFLDKLVVGYINDRVGFGVFAREAIPAQSLVAICAGAFISRKYGVQSDYALNTVGLNQTSFLQNAGIEIITDSLNMGGIGRLFQHGPVSLQSYFTDYLCSQLDNPAVTRFRSHCLDNEVLLPCITSKQFEPFAKMFKVIVPAEYFIEGEDNAKFAAANLQLEHFNMKSADGESDVQFPFLYSMRELKAGEPLIWNYTMSYWRGKEFVLFDQEGVPTEKTVRICGWRDCKKSDSEKSFQQCGRCKKIYYCGAECQKAHWPIHKNSCIPKQG